MAERERKSRWRRAIVFACCCCVLGAITTVGVAWVIAFRAPGPGGLGVKRIYGLEESGQRWIVLEMGNRTRGLSQQRVSGWLDGWEANLTDGILHSGLPPWASRPPSGGGIETHITRGFGLPFLAFRGIGIYLSGWSETRGYWLIGILGQERWIPRYIIWPGFIANMLIYGALWAGAILGLRWLRRRFLRPAWACRHCGYDLRKLPSAVCPECGVVNTSASVNRASDT